MFWQGANDAVAFVLRLARRAAFVALIVIGRFKGENFSRGSWRAIIKIKRQLLRDEDDAPFRAGAKNHALELGDRRSQPRVLGLGRKQHFGQMRRVG
jgi:hypothetical protein